jgi:chlorophyllide a reductase subunit X
VVCGGFGLPIARDMCQKVIVVGSNDLQSLYVANNVCSAVEYFRKLGGNVGVAGLVINKDDGTGEAQAFADAVGIPVLARSPPMTTSAASPPTTRSSAAPRPWASLFESWPGRSPKPADPPGPLSQAALLGLFKGERAAASLNPARWRQSAASFVVNLPSKSSTRALTWTTATPPNLPCHGAAAMRDGRARRRQGGAGPR